MAFLVIFVMKVFHLILFFGMFLSSCKGHFFYEDLYTRANRREIKFAELYRKQDTFCISKIQFCHLIGHRGINTSSSIFFDPKSIGNSLKLSYSKFFQPLSCNRNKENIENIIIQNCYSTEKKLKLFNNCCDNIILPKLIITSNSGKNTEGGGGITFVQDMGDDRHLLEYKLITSIYQNDTLIYMDNRAYWTRVISERGEQLHYQVPQEVIETLVTLSLEEYFKRVKK
jgi:hypothetical protein